MDRRKSDTSSGTCTGARPKLTGIRIPLDVRNEEDNELCDINLLTVEPSLYERRRANSDPFVSHIRALQASFPLPEITVEDFSDSDKQCFQDKANTQEGAFSVHTSPPRPRSNTCPDDLFRKKAAARPPTPPPMSVAKKNPFGGFPRRPSRERVSFAPHKLSKLTEDTGDSRSSSSSNQSSNSSSCKGCGQNTKRGLQGTRNCVTAQSTVVTNTSDVCEFNESDTNQHVTVASQQLAGDPCTSIGEQGTNAGTGVNVGAGVSVVSGTTTSLNDCVRSYTQTSASKSVDGKPLQAC